ncbi:MAG: TrpR-like protein, YerC/YecD [Clostridia bacterium]|nr:TrpR-like protein, YerC/YecD [Clostridia bacterium]
MARQKITEDKDFLFKCILALETPEECYDFFGDLCTAKELEEMSRRISAAKLLHEDHVYTEVKEKTGLSTATISRVSRCLQDSDDGYVRVLERVLDK